MNEQNEINKKCHACGHERGFDNYHRLYVACKKCASARSVKHYQKNREKKLEKARIHRENDKDKPKRNRKTIDTCTENIQDLYNQITTLTEMLKSTTLVV